MNYLLTFLAILIAQTHFSVEAFFSGYHRDITTFTIGTRTSSKVVSTRLALANEKEGATSTGIELSTLRELTDHDAEGRRIALSITGWLDEEWFPQEVHVRMAEQVEKTYIKSRNDGDIEIMDVMVKVADDLNKNWSEYDKDAFVNGWDIGNYVADYLTNRLGDECSSCSAKIFVPEENE